jgi:diguanylate cyclase (GGDEF)-like protein
MNRPAGSLDPALARIVTALAAIIALFLALSLPAAYFLSAHAARQAVIDAEAKLAAVSVSQIASANPTLWIFENARIRGMLAVLGPPPEAELRTVFGTGGELIAEQGGDVPRPVMVATSPVHDSGVVVGRVDVQRSQRPLFAVTAVIAVLASLLGTGAFVVLQSQPLRLLKRALARSAHLATHDILTGLPNRALFQDRLEQALAWARREGASLAVIYLDLDHFKVVNDTLGHAAGDRLLVGVTARLRSCVRETDTLSRLGGDEFAIVQIGARQVADTELLAQRLIETMAAPFDLDGHQVTAGASLGIALRSVTDLLLSQADAGLLLQEADVALYRAKEEGRGTYQFFSADMNRRLVERQALEADMQSALENGQFKLHYQPQFDLSERRIIGAEALIRWRHPRRGDIAPEGFIPLAEETGLIIRIGEWVLREACRQAVAWPSLRCMAVNVSPVQFRRAGFIQQVQRALQQSGLEPSRLEVEITEGVLLSETAETLATLHHLRSMGVAVAMDDFGTGYSSLGYLQKFRFDKIKIDRSFVRNLAVDPQAAEIVWAVLRMSHAMGIRVNAEGVEDEQQATMLQDEGCEEVQGFLFGGALAAAEFTELLARGTCRLPARAEASMGD